MNSMEFAIVTVMLGFNRKFGWMASNFPGAMRFVIERSRHLSKLKLL